MLWGTMNIDLESLAAFAQALFSLASRVKKLKPADKYEKSQFRGAMKAIVQSVGNLQPARVSRSALEVAKVLELDDLPSLRWDRQKKKDPGRKKLLREHKTPVSWIVERAISCESDKQVQDLLARMEIAWITREEDDRLSENGHRSKRPDSDDAYRKAGIELLPLPQ